MSLPKTLRALTNADFAAETTIAHQPPEPSLRPLKTNSRGTWKTGRYSLGPIKGGAVRLTPAAESLQLTESVEDALALLQMTGRPTWAVPGAGFIPTFEPPPEVTELVLAPDHDAAGLQAIERL